MILGSRIHSARRQGVEESSAKGIVQLLWRRQKLPKCGAGGKSKAKSYVLDLRSCLFIPNNFSGETRDNNTVNHRTYLLATPVEVQFPNKPSTYTKQFSG
jgi:hypothetical protein